MMNHVLGTLSSQERRRCVGPQPKWSNRSPAERNLARAAVVGGPAKQPLLSRTIG
jgi:hypothetical protein